MTPIYFQQANKVFGPPPDMDENQVQRIHAHVAEAASGSCDGSPMVVVAWQPNIHELSDIVSGGPVFLTVIGGLPPHFLTTRFEQAINPV